LQSTVGHHQQATEVREGAASRCNVAGGSRPGCGTPRLLHDGSQHGRPKPAQSKRNRRQNSRFSSVPPAPTEWKSRRACLTAISSTTRRHVWWCGILSVRSTIEVTVTVVSWSSSTAEQLSRVGGAARCDDGDNLHLASTGQGQGSAGGHDVQTGGA
jgi:hypothetical protein